MSKARLNLNIDDDLMEFVKTFAAENRTTVTDVVTQYFLSLKRRSVSDATSLILSDPAFKEAMEESLDKLRGGKAEWHSFDDVFGKQ